MLSTKAKRISRSIHSWSYEDFDSYGNLKRQANTTYGGYSNVTMTENFNYDKLHRLTRSETSGTYIPETDPLTVTYHFDAVGNIKNMRKEASNNIDLSYRYK